MIHYFSECTGCSACTNICPQNCIQMIEDEDGFAYPRIMENKCIQCNICGKICPILNEQRCKLEIQDVHCYAVINQEEEIRMASSSGGVFYALARYILEEKQGVVFGAMFNSQFDVCHGFVENVEELNKLMGSKYVQSDIGMVYQQVKSFLQKKRVVYFSGTPCQIAGLKAYLGQEFENTRLICQDIICHGIPSPGIWRKYLRERNIERKKITKIEFRAKEFGWNDCHLKITYDDKTNYMKSNGTDEYILPFLMNLNLRMSCFDCQYKGIERLADITLADFWGIENYDATMSDKKGTSLVLTHSEKAERLLHSLTGIKIKEKKLEEAINDEYNMSALESPNYTKRAAMYMKDVRKKGVIGAYKYYFNANLLQKIMRKCRGI